MLKVYAYFYTDKHGNRRLDSFKPRTVYRKRKQGLVSLGRPYRGSFRYAVKFYTNPQAMHFAWEGFRTSYEVDVQRYGPRLNLERMPNDHHYH